MATNGHTLNSKEYAVHLDSIDPLAHLRDEFYIPTKKDLQDEATPEINEPVAGQSIYFCGNSLGLQPKRVKKIVDEELDVWAKRGVMGHHSHGYSRPWITTDENVTTYMADIVGASTSEVAVMGGLTSNIHFLLAAFYKPTKERYQIIMEGKAFPSDQYAVTSQLLWRGQNLENALVTIDPEEGSFHLQTKQILQTIEFHKDTAALIMLSGVQYYTGQAFDMKKITKYAQERGIVVGWDLAHAVGNIVLELHDWDVDFAAWCSYKYLNSGPGGIAGIFVHDKHVDQPRLSGWWGHDKQTRFAMGSVFKAIPGAAGYQHSNPSVMATACLLGSLQVFSQTNMKDIRKKSLKLTGYLEELLNEIADEYGNDMPYKIITPSTPNDRGAQLSIMFRPGLMLIVLKFLEKNGVVVDERKPDVIRVAPVPLYNTFQDVWLFAGIFKEALKIALSK